MISYPPRKSRTSAIPELINKCVMKTLRIQKSLIIFYVHKHYEDLSDSRSTSQPSYFRCIHFSIYMIFYLKTYIEFQIYLLSQFKCFLMPCKPQYKHCQTLCTLALKFQQVYICQCHRIQESMSNAIIQEMLTNISEDKG